MEEEGEVREANDEAKEGQEGHLRFLLAEVGRKVNAVALRHHKGDEQNGIVNITTGSDILRIRCCLNGAVKPVI